MRNMSVVVLNYGVSLCVSGLNCMGDVYVS